MNSLPTDEQIEGSRQRLMAEQGMPADWQWFPCANGCGDVVWCPPDVGDVAKVEPVCTSECALQLIAKRDGRD